MLNGSFRSQSVEADDCIWVHRFGTIGAFRGAIYVMLQLLIIGKDRVLLICG